MLDIETSYINGFILHFTHFSGVATNVYVSDKVLISCVV